VSRAGVGDDPGFVVDAQPLSARAARATINDRRVCRIEL
jgi:hypothetical protein